MESWFNTSVSMLAILYPSSTIRRNLLQTLPMTNKSSGSNFLKTSRRTSSFKSIIVVVGVSIRVRFANGDDILNVSRWKNSRFKSRFYRRNIKISLYFMYSHSINDISNLLRNSFELFRLLFLSRGIALLQFRLCITGLHIAQWMNTQHFILTVYSVLPTNSVKKNEKTKFKQLPRLITTADWMNIDFETRIATTLPHENDSHSEMIVAARLRLRKYVSSNWMDGSSTVFFAVRWRPTAPYSYSSFNNS